MCVYQNRALSVLCGVMVIHLWRFGYPNRAHRALASNVIIWNGVANITIQMLCGEWVCKVLNYNY